MTINSPADQSFVKKHKRILLFVFMFLFILAYKKIPHEFDQNVKKQVPLFIVKVWKGIDHVFMGFNFINNSIDMSDELMAGKTLAKLASEVPKHTIEGLSSQAASVLDLGHALLAKTDKAMTQFEITQYQQSITQISVLLTQMEQMRSELSAEGLKWTADNQPILHDGVDQSVQQFNVLTLKLTTLATELMQQAKPPTN